MFYRRLLLCVPNPAPSRSWGSTDKGVQGCCWQMFIFRHSSHSGEWNTTISLLKIRQVPKQFPGSDLHSAQVSSTGFAVALTKSLVVTQKSQSISLCHQPWARAEHEKLLWAFCPSNNNKKVREMREQKKAFCCLCSCNVLVAARRLAAADKEHRSWGRAPLLSQGQPSLSTALPPRQALLIACFCVSFGRERPRTRGNAGSIKSLIELLLRNK